MKVHGCLFLVIQFQHLHTFSSLLPRNTGMTASQRWASKAEAEKTSGSHANQRNSSWKDHIMNFAKTSDSKNSI